VKSSITDTAELDFDHIEVGDELYCLAWIGKKFTVVDKDDAAGRIALAGASATDPYGAMVDIFRDSVWMVTNEPWDQIWYWPDRAGERYIDVYRRWIDGRAPGDVVLGHFLDTGLITAGGFLRPKPALAMAFRIEAIDESFAQVRVEPVVLAADPGRRLAPADLAADPSAWVVVGPRLPVRIGMHTYRWGLSVGDMILNGDDFTKLSAAS
jgi:hypothetical protein